MQPVASIDTGAVKQIKLNDIISGSVAHKHGRTQTLKLCECVISLLPEIKCEVKKRMA